MARKTKKCTGCKVFKPVAEFTRNTATADGLEYRCRKCISRFNKRYYESHKEARKEEQKTRRANYEQYELDSQRESRWSRIHQINFTVVRYNEMFLEQKGCCAICGRHQSEFKKALAVDHDHLTGEIRSLLCNPCNLIIGQLEIQSEIRVKCGKYLSNWSIKKKPKIIS